MSNKKNKKSQSSANKPQKVQPFTESVKAEVDAFEQQVNEIATADADEATLGYGDQETLNQCRENQDVVTYLNKLEKLHKVLVASQRKADEKQQEADKNNESASKNAEEAKKQLSEAEETKKSLENEKNTYREELDKEYEDKLKECNEREAKVLERELALDNGKHSVLMANLLDSFRASQEKVFEDSKKLAEKMAANHEEMTSKYEELMEQEQNLHRRSEELDKREKALNKKEATMEADHEIAKEDAREDLEDEFDSKFEELKHQNEMLKVRNSRIEKERDEYLNKYNKLCADFGSDDPEDMRKRLAMLQDETTRLQQQIDENPSKTDYDILEEKYQAVFAKNKELEGKLNEEELLSLKLTLEKADSFQVELSAKDKELRTAQFQLETYKTALESMQSAIETMKGEREKNRTAFEFASQYDNDKVIQQTTLSPTNPQGLAQLCDYLQRSMATQSRPFYYEKGTIASFLAGLNMSGLTILQGISGTGKTSLPREIARTMLCSSRYEGENLAPYRICAIQSGWRDNMDLMGYYNAFEHKYNETDFFKALYLAGQPKYKDTLFFIILDEMNLSHPEHYFADFLSLLEQPEDERFIGIKAPKEVWPKSVIDGRLRVPANVRFIGTANQDETTLDFAPKTYDRSNLLELPKNHPAMSLYRPERQYNVSYTWLSTKFKEAERDHSGETSKFLNLITKSSDFHRLMSEIGIGWGNRFEVQAQRFIPVYIGCEPAKDPKECLAKAADHLLTTRLLRPLQNHYELQSKRLNEFKDDFDTIFELTFNVKPEKADRFLQEIIKKKNSDADL